MSVFDDKPRPQGLKNPFASLPEIPPLFWLVLVALLLLGGAAWLLASQVKPQVLSIRFSHNPLDLTADQNYSILAVRIENVTGQPLDKTTLRVTSPEPNLVILPVKREFSIPAGDVREFEFQILPSPHEKRLPSGVYSLYIRWETASTDYNASTRLEIKS